MSEIVSKYDSPEIVEKRKNTEATLAGITNLPSIPKVIFELTQLLKSHTADTQSLANLIGKDQGLTTKILMVANSPLYGMRRKVSSLEFAIMVLGVEEISNIVTALALQNAIRIESGKDFHYPDFWLHGMIVGTGAKQIARHLGYIDLATDTFVAGMLHDTGIQLIYKYFPNEFEAIVEKGKSANGSFLNAEYEVLGMSHQEIGAFLAQRWELPQLLTDVLGHHHNPSNARDSMLAAAIVHLTDYMTLKLDVAPFYWDKDLQLDEKICAELGFDSCKDIDAFVDDFAEIFKEAAEAIHF